jgi:hypothetical protein
MHVVSVDHERIRFAVCIPSRGRAALLKKTLTKMPFLNCPDTFVGYEYREDGDYLEALSGTRVFQDAYDNPTGSVAVARERLRLQVVHRHTSYDYVVVTDDNANYSEKSLHNLVATLHTYRRVKPKPSMAIMAGMHSTASHFDRHRIAASEEEYGGYHSYQHFGMIFQAYPMELYQQYTYPADAYGLDDRHLLCWAINRGLPAERFRIAMDAPFTKSRYQVGGQGSVAERAVKCGKAIARLATDFPAIVGAKGTFPIAWQTAFALRDGKQLDRLAGGAMRKEAALETPTVRVKRATRR